MNLIDLKPIRASLLSITVFTMTMNAKAAMLVINNPSFEAPVTGAGTFSGGVSSPPTDWTVYNTVATNSNRQFGVWNPTGTQTFEDRDAPNEVRAPDGVNVGVVFLRNTSNFAEAGLQQILAATLQLNTTYTLTVEVGNFADDNNMDSFDFDGFPGYRIDLMADGNPIPLASDLNTLMPGEGIFETSTVSFTTGSSHTDAGQALAIRLVNLNGSGIEVNFDDVRLDATPVPEPSTAILGAIGMICGLLKRNRISSKA
jgi:hypothetical protein